MTQPATINEANRRHKTYGWTGFAIAIAACIVSSIGFEQFWAPIMIAAGLVLTRGSYWGGWADGCTYGTNLPRMTETVTTQAPQTWTSGEPS